MGIVVIVLLAGLIFAYLAVPLLVPSQADPLPNLRDPITQDLEEERDALFRAIRELDAREDLPETRRAELHARYEAKAAKVLRALDERQAELRGQPTVKRPTTPRRIPYAVLSLLGIMVVSASLLGGNLAARVGEDATVTTSDEGQLEAGRELLELQNAVRRDPTEETLLSLADAYWRLNDADQAEATYQRIIAEVDPTPAVAYRRLGFLTLQEDTQAALGYLERARTADPQDLETLFALGELYFAMGNVQAAEETWESYLAAPGGAEDGEVQARLQTVRELAPLVQAATDNPSEANLIALADAYWQREERESASSVYLRVLSEVNPNNAQAMSRIGQMLFFSGRNEDAVAALERARTANPENLQTLLFLGNAHFSLGQFQAAIDVWESYVEVAGGPERAGRVPGLIQDARDRLSNAPQNSQEDGAS